MRRPTSVAVVFALACLGATNPIDPVGFVEAVVAVILMVIAVELVVVAIEGAIYTKLVPLARGRAFFISFIANLASFLVGIAVGSLTTVLGRTVGWGSAVQGLYALVNVGVSLVIEIPIVLYLTADVWRPDSSGVARRKIFWLAFYTNLVVCGLLQAGLLVFRGRV